MARDAGTRPTLDDVRLGARFFINATRLLRQPPVPSDPLPRLRERLANRDANFLTLIRTRIYGNPSGPYRRLLDIAGCEYGDVERSAALDGIEGTLRSLF